MIPFHLQHRESAGTRHSDRSPFGLEEQLLLYFARVSMNPEMVERVKDMLRGNIDWGVLISAAELHGLRPLLCRHLNSLCPELVPKDVLAGLYKHFMMNAARNLGLTAELLRILALFESHGIAAIPFKGPVAAISIYGDLALREFDDLDILVQQESLSRAEQIISSQGYRPEIRVPRAQRQLHLRTDCEKAYIREDATCRVELHWLIAAHCFPFPIDIEKVWKRHRYIQLGDARVRSFSPEDTLLILCAHGAKHLWDRLELICSVAEFIRVQLDIEWQQLLTRARETRVRHILSLGLLLAHEILGAELPEKILDTVRRDSAARKLAMRVREKLFRGDPNSERELEQYVFYRRLADRWRDGMLVLPKAVFTPSAPDWDLVELPPLLAPLYYPLRVFRLLKKYALDPAIHDSFPTESFAGTDKGLEH